MVTIFKVSLAVDDADLGRAHRRLQGLKAPDIGFDLQADVRSEIE
ncbi:hypothetical protein [Mesorhizobium sangaii]|uniref:Uncharacterized protein n=1 Tax=Mesorhizobium sangaii TaxID=505389 RepID=A0A841PKK8_9HYPH|nr:hypothetical protein [Mesorhizobium sangaii]MBB6409015.1 hypothetical protein [Mesorhizobium sangaii]